MACSQTFILQANGRDSLRLLPDALTLTAACVWLTNSLHARPEDGPASRRLMDAALPLTDPEGVSDTVLGYRTSTAARAEEDVEEDEGEEEEEEEDGHPRAGAPYIPYGCIFLRRMVIGDVPRLRFGGPALPSSIGSGRPRKKSPINTATRECSTRLRSLANAPRRTKG